MHTEINSIINNFFHKDNLEQVTRKDIEDFIGQYPYFAPARYLLAKKLHDENGTATEELITAGLYINNPLRLHWLLTNSEEPMHQDHHHKSNIIQDAGQEASTQENAVQEQRTEEPPIAFQSYHTIDYFASQGIRLQQADLSKDKLGQQLKSFTEWLRSMKKLPASEIEAPKGAEDENRQQNVIRSAAHSIEEEEVYTESMAEVWKKQGNTARAISIYMKLSLLNPDKSAYFAAKIDQLKEQ
jgi:hypothetical protein